MAISLGLDLGTLLAGFGSGLFGGLGEEALIADQKASKAKARDYLTSGYDTSAYESPYAGWFDEMINTYGAGNLTKSQEDQLTQATKEGVSNIGTVMANRGGSIGGQLAATEKLNTNIASQRSSMADENVGTALNLANIRDSFNLSTFLQAQNNKNTLAQLLAQYS